MNIAKRARPDRISWRPDKRGRLRPTWGYDIPPPQIVIGYVADRVKTDVPSQRLLPPVPISLASVEALQHEPNSIDEALAARGVRVVSRAPLMLSPRRTCQWIEGDPTSPNPFRCAEPVTRGSYCDCHAARAFRPRAA